MKETIEDFKKKYKGTFVFLTIEGKKHLVRFNDITTANRKIYYLFDSRKTGPLILDEKTVEDTLEFKFPKQGLYNVLGECVFFSRWPERQWKRAPCEANTFMSSLVSKYIRTQGFKTNEATLSEIYEENYPKDLDEAIDNLNVSTALNRSFGISLNTIKRNPPSLLLFYNDNPIGFVLPNEREIEVYHPALYQEVLDFCKYKETSWKPVLVN